MTDENDFLRAIAADPEDRPLRLIFADWLEEKGRGDEATKVREQFTPIVLRPYQEQAKAAFWEAIAARDDSPCVVIPCGGGKTPLMAAICQDAVYNWNGRILILAHVRELLEQSVDKLQKFGLGQRVGVYSAGLKRRDTESQILVAGIQSVYNLAFELGKFDLILVDECHLIPPDGEGRYRTFLREARLVNPLVRIGGFTATPYRLDCGNLCTPEGILNHVCYEANIKDLIREGYLAPVRSRKSNKEFDTSQLHVRGGEFIPGEVELLFSADEALKPALDEVVQVAQERQSVLIFAAGIQHALQIAGELRLRGQVGRVITGKTADGERAEIIGEFKERRLKFLVNVGVLTTGFDATCVDLVVLLRATMSPGLYAQMCGRGFRLHPRKTDALILDYGGNIARHGPVDEIQIKGPHDGDGESPTRFCPECGEVIPLAATVCPHCNAELPRTDPVGPSHALKASNRDVLSSDQTEIVWVPVTRIEYRVHYKRGAAPGSPRTLRVIYSSGFAASYSEWICIEHEGYARSRASLWWFKRSKAPFPASAEHAQFLAENDCLACPTEIQVQKKPGEQYWSVSNYRLPEKPDPPADIEARWQEQCRQDAETAKTFQAIYPGQASAAVDWWTVEETPLPETQEKEYDDEIPF